MISDARATKNSELLKLGQDIMDYVMSGDFTRYKKAKTILRTWNWTDEAAAFSTGMKQSTIRVARRNLSNELYELFGYDFFKVVGLGDKKAVADGRGRLDLVIRGFNAEEFLSYDLISSIFAKSDASDDIDINTCGQEIQFLVRHSKQSIEDELSVLDCNKLAYLIRMLNNETGSLTNIRKLVNCFERGNKNGK